MFSQFNQQYLWSLGVMSGTSLDAIDLAMLKTDGEIIIEHGAVKNIAIPDDLRQKLQDLMGEQALTCNQKLIKPTIHNNINIDFLSIEQQYSNLVANAICEFIADITDKPDIIGFHGQTIIHRPHQAITWQLGNANIIAQQTGIGVISDFRRRDMAAGGQGAPLVPIYHAALAHNLPKPIALLNIGGVANVTYIGDAGELIAFDTGAGNALLNDFVRSHTGENYDDGGKYAAAGKADLGIVEQALQHDYFNKTPPKSLDRNQFDAQISNAISELGLHDGAATLMQFTVASIIKSQQFFPKPAKKWVICGGGVHNKAMMQSLQSQLNVLTQFNVPVIASEQLGWRSDFVEAEAFAYLAVRSLRGLPLTFPSTTGVNHAVTGGVFCQS